MNIKPETEIISEEGVNLYDYWKVLVKRKRLFIVIFLVPLAVVTIVSLIVPRYYRGESEISILALPAFNIVSFIGNIDDIQKVKIFANNSGAIKNVSVSLPKNAPDKVNIIINAEAANIIPQAFKDMVDYISNLPVIKEEIIRKREETDLKIRNLIEARKANTIFLNQITDMMKKRQISFISSNPADLIKKDADLSLEIMNLQKAELKPVTLGPLLITKQPSNSQITLIIIFTGLFSFLTGIFVVFFLEYIDRIRTRENT